MWSRKRVLPYMQPIIFFSCRNSGPGTLTSEPSGIMPTMQAVPPARTMSHAWRAALTLPMASKAISTPSPPVSSLIASTASTLAPLTVSVAPKFSAISSLLSRMSTAMMRLAPAMRQPWMTLRPTPPQPITATIEPPGTLAV